MPQVRERYTTVDLAATPDDGQRYEVIDGSLVVTPAPGGKHQYVVGKLYTQLQKACPPGLIVLAGIQIANEQVLIPDLAVVSCPHPLPVTFAPTDVVLVVEVTSPGQAPRDTETKRRIYAEMGIETYVIVEPDQLVHHWLARGRYLTVNTGRTVALVTPFPVRISLPLT